MAVTEQGLLAALTSVQDPHTGQDFVSTRALRNVQIHGGDVAFDVELGYPAKSLLPELRRSLVAAAKGVATVIWSYPRGEAITKDGETAIDVAAYAAQIAALIGAHIIKIKLSTDHLMLPKAKKVYEDKKIDIATQAKRVAHCMQASFNGRRIVVFSGGAAKGADAVFDDARAIRDGGGNGSIIGRNSFQRSREDALEMLGKLVDIYLGKA